MYNFLMKYKCNIFVYLIFLASYLILFINTCYGATWIFLSEAPGDGRLYLDTESIKVDKKRAL